MKLSLVTGTLDRPGEIRRLVDSVLRHTECEFELIVADASAKPMVAGDPRVRVMHEKPRLGYVKGYNRAFREAKGEFVLWLNDDAEVLPGYDTKALGFMESHPHIGLGCLSFSDRLWPREFMVCRFWGIPYANFGIIRRELGDRLGWFWENLQMYGSDNAITFEVLLAGYGVAGIDGALIHHHRPDDAVREANQAGRKQDNWILQERYQPRLHELRWLYRRNLRPQCVYT